VLVISLKWLMFYQAKAICTTLTSNQLFSTAARNVSPSKFACYSNRESEVISPSYDPGMGDSRSWKHTSAVEAPLGCDKLSYISGKIYLCILCDALCVA
jgi:hypothetical protein